MEQQEPVCSIILNRPPLNIIDHAMIGEIQAALRNAENHPDTRIIVFRGAGEKGFSAGVSIQDHTPERIREVIPDFDEIFRQLARTEKVTVAAVHGVCFGGGMEQRNEPRLQLPAMGSHP